MGKWALSGFIFGLLLISLIILSAATPSQRPDNVNDGKKVATSGVPNKAVTPKGRSATTRPKSPAKAGKDDDGTNGGGDDGGGEEKTVYDLANRLDARKFVQLIDKAGMKDILAGTDEVTVFVPTDKFLETVPPNVLNFITGNKLLLRSILKYHIAEGKHMLHDADNDYEKKVSSMYNDVGIWVRKYGDIMTANGYELSEVDQTAANGVVHLMDGFFLPLPEGNSARVLQLTPAFQQFFRLVRRAGLMEEYFSGDEPYTVFVPRNSAFTKLSPTVFYALSTNVQGLRELVRQHIVKGIYYSSSLDGDVNELTTVGGTTLKLKRDKGAYFVNNARFDLGDITTFNGVLHSVNEILSPSLDYLEGRFGGPNISPGKDAKPTQRPPARQPIPPVRPAATPAPQVPPRRFPQGPPQRIPGYHIPSGGFQPRPEFTRPQRPPAPYPRIPNGPSQDGGQNGFLNPGQIDGRQFISADEAHIFGLEDMVIQARKAGVI